MSEYLIIAENIIYRNNKLTCINIFDHLSAVALPAEFNFDLAVICGPNWTVGEHKLVVEARTNTNASFVIGEIVVNIPNENFVYNAIRQNLKMVLDYSIKDITFVVKEADKEIISRKYLVKSLLVPRENVQEQPVAQEKTATTAKKESKKSK